MNTPQKLSAMTAFILATNVAITAHAQTSPMTDPAEKSQPGSVIPQPTDTANSQHITSQSANEMKAGEQGKGEGGGKSKKMPSPKKTHKTSPDMTPESGTGMGTGTGMSPAPK